MKKSLIEELPRVVPKKEGRVVCAKAVDVFGFESVVIKKI